METRHGIQDELEPARAIDLTPQQLEQVADGDDIGMIPPSCIGGVSNFESIDEIKQEKKRNFRIMPLEEVPATGPEILPQGHINKPGKRKTKKIYPEATVAATPDRISLETIPESQPPLPYKLHSNDEKFKRIIQVPPATSHAESTNARNENGNVAERADNNSPENRSTNLGSFNFSNDPQSSNTSNDPENPTLITAENPTLITNELRAPETTISQEPFQVPHAVLVQEDPQQELSGASVVTILAEPLAPWWKQKRTKYLATAVLILMIGLVAVIAVMMLMRPKETIMDAVLLNDVSLTPAPSFSQWPSTAPTIAAPVLTTAYSIEESTSLMPITAPPSLSQTPSSSPTACKKSLLTNAHDFGLHHLTGILYSLDIDGKNAVIGKAGHLSFYSWVVDHDDDDDDDDDGHWEKTGVLSNVCEFTPQPAVAISGDVAVIGCHYDDANDASRAGTVYIYEKETKTGVWSKSQGPIVPNDGISTSQIYFGSSLDIHGDVIVVGSQWSSLGAVYVFHRKDTSSSSSSSSSSHWDQMKIISPPDSCHEWYNFGSSIAIHQSTIAIASDCSGGSIFTYRYNPDSDTMITYHDRLDVGQFDIYQPIGLFGNYIAYHEIGSGVNVFYSQSESEQPFVLQQQFTNLEHDESIGIQIAISEDTLAISGNTSEHSLLIIMKLGTNGFWEESMRIELLDIDVVKSIEISDHHLIVGSWFDAKSFNLNECW